MSKRAVLILGGSPPPPTLLKTSCFGAAEVIAVDGGIHAFNGTTCQPTLHIGDFDSSKPHSAVKTISCPEQDRTDLQKALEYIPADVRDLDVLGSNGGRSDHVLTNLHILAHASLELHIRCLNQAETLVRVLPGQPLETSCPPGTQASLIPATQAATITTKGLKWELTDEQLVAGIKLGQSNETISPDIRVEVKDGIAWVILQHVADGL